LRGLTINDDEEIMLEKEGHSGRATKKKKLEPKTQHAAELQLRGKRHQSHLKDE